MDEDTKLILDEDMTLAEHVLAWTGYGFCEIAFNIPDKLWFLFGWTYPLGNWFYKKAFERHL